MGAFWGGVSPKVAIFPALPLGYVFILSNEYESFKICVTSLHECSICLLDKMASVSITYETAGICPTTFYTPQVLKDLEVKKYQWRSKEKRIKL